ncbi:trypsin-like peptidase domain-containing protein [Streptomyces sp. NPDC001107]
MTGAVDATPRPVAGTAPVEGSAALAHDGADGDFELDPPTGVRSGTAASEAAGEPGRPEGADDDASVREGDFELGEPEGCSGVRAAVAEGDAGSDSAVSTGESGRRPTAVGGGAGAPHEGDFELRAPGDTAGSEAEGGLVGGLQSAAAAPGSEDPGTGGDFELDPPAEAAPFADKDQAAVTASAPPAADRPQPLHDPDPYSTPPYGEPGPWAPAPPVQHPAARPAQGTAIPTPTPPYAASAPVSPSAPGSPVAPAATSTPHATPPPVSPSAPGSPVAPTLASTPQAEPTPLPPSPPATPVAGMPTPLPGSEPPSAPEPTQPPGISQPPSAAVPMAASAPALLSTPWQNYDPWAPAPLQQTGAAVDGEVKRRRRVRRGLVGGAVVLALVSGGVGGGVGAYLERNGGLGAVELPQAGKEPAGRAPDSVAGIAARALPSVVTLHVTGADESGTGTGFVLDDQGHILTNNHVVEPAAGSTGGTGDISVTFNSGDTAKATVVGRDSGYDLAVVKVSNVRGLKPMALGNSDNVQVGDPVVAIGAPFDLEGTVTSGIISAKERPITAGGDSPDGSDVSYVDALQTDAPINPGNSGGPLLDSKARVIGINSAIRSADSSTDESGQAGSIGLGFAIPVNQAKRVAEELINTGKATHPVIGVTLDMDYTGDGARVGTKASGGGPAVTRGGPGDKAGIEAGDIITEVDGERVHSGEELIVKTRAHRPGDRLELTVRRDGKESKISLVLGSADGN